jgi:hypothetical protein
MKPCSLLTLSLIACLLAACTTSTSTTTAQPPSAQATTAPSQVLVPTPIPVVTSRGPNLEASDPSTVSMVSGGLQFVEFFEFW